MLLAFTSRSGGRNTAARSAEIEGRSQSYRTEEICQSYAEFSGRGEAYDKFSEADPEAKASDPEDGSEYDVGN